MASTSTVHTCDAEGVNPKYVIKSTAPTSCRSLSTQPPLEIRHCSRKHALDLSFNVERQYRYMDCWLKCLFRALYGAGLCSYRNPLAQGAGGFARTGASIRYYTHTPFFIIIKKKKRKSITQFSSTLRPRGYRPPAP